MKDLKIPNHVAIVMDGNGRWAKERGLPRSAGHKKGAENFEKLVLDIFNLGINIISVYAFSRENFKRSSDEVNYLMELFIKMFKEKSKKYNDNNIKIVFSGEREPLEKRVLEAMDEITINTSKNTKYILNICLNYSGDYEIVQASKKIVQDVILNKLDINQLDTLSFYNYLYQNLPPIDLFIRTSGEYRLSNFMLYQLSYAEMCFPKVYFPDFTKKEFIKCLEEYSKRDRRFGNVSNK